MVDLPQKNHQRIRFVAWAVGGTLAVAALTLLLPIALPWPQTWWPHLAAGAILVVTASEGWYARRRDLRLRAFEHRFPDLLRHLATNHSSGLTLAASIATSAEGDYGALNPELRRMRTQLSFHAPLSEVLTDFAERVGSPLVRRSVGLIQDAMRSGARTTEALHAAARDAARLVDLEAARNARLSQYVAIVYVAAFVFLLVVFVLARYFVGTVFAGQPPSNGRGVETVFADPAVGATFNSLFIWAGTISGAGSGFVIGALLRGRPTAGLHHSFLLTLVAYVVISLATML